MSEFSESYHLRTHRSEDAIQLLRRAKLQGYVYKPSNGWVTFLVEGGVFEPDQRIVAVSVHPLLHYVSAEDHGWSFALFDCGRVISSYRCDWDSEIVVDDSTYSRSALETFVPSARALLDQFEKFAHPTDFDELFESEPAKLFARAMELEHYEWLAYDYMARDFHESPEDHPDVTKV